MVSADPRVSSLTVQIRSPGVAQSWAPLTVPPPPARAVLPLRRGGARGQATAADPATATAQAATATGYAAVSP